ncbi:shikimate dehydrogenase [Brevundimonas sp. NIBR11]|uniref:shikimate dehydrogenase family protein n=1 Tax=Brevundimonas sp. NIBR11 TaxID=3015999 RepID=UPI0022F11790|nr:shikimate dehydrogenase [Brevundimonas sp. NIBR11]WGM32651.1 Shikimate dehydrogenase (NADP(+)) [Brevundimonas sp. NIBR11]
MSRARITGAVKVGGIVGHPVAHSLSPVIHNAWIEAAGLDAAYVAFAPSDPAGFEALVAAGRAGLLAGVNVTAPFKEQAYRLADTASETARDSGSANILAFRDGQVRADSADGLGLLRALQQQAPNLSLAGSPVVMLGAGGAARAAAATLAGAGALVRIVNRTRDRAEALAADLGGSVTVADGPAAFDGAALIVNALSVRPEIDLATLDPATTIMDMTYKPVVTPFLQAGRDAGLGTVDGLAMLIGQAGPSFEAIFGVAPPDLDPRPILLAHLGETA